MDGVVISTGSTSPRVRRGRPVLLLLLALSLLLVGTAGVAPASAGSGWTQAATTQAPVAAHALSSPSSVTCHSSLLQTTFAWPEVDSRYDYRVELRRVDTGVVTVSRTASGSATSVTFSGVDGLGLAVGIGTVELRARVTSYLAATPSWESATPTLAGRVVVDTRLVSLGVTC